MLRQNVKQILNKLFKSWVKRKCGFGAFPLTGPE